MALLQEADYCKKKSIKDLDTLDRSIWTGEQVRRYARQYEMTGQTGSAGVSSNIAWVVGHFDYLDQIGYSEATAAAIVVAREADERSTVSSGARLLAVHLGNIFPTGRVAG